MGTTLEDVVDELTEADNNIEQTEPVEVEHNVPKIDAGTIARTIILFLGLINQILVMRGIQTIPIADELINQLVALVWSVGASVWAWWKDNSFTVRARLLHLSD